MTAARWLVTGAAFAVAVLAVVVAVMTQRNVQSARRQIERQNSQIERQVLVNTAVLSALKEQRQLNRDMSRSVIRLMRQQTSRTLAISTP